MSATPFIRDTVITGLTLIGLDKEGNVPLHDVNNTFQTIITRVFKPDSESTHRRNTSVIPNDYYISAFLDKEDYVGIGYVPTIVVFRIVEAGVDTPVAYSPYVGFLSNGEECNENRKTAKMVRLYPHEYVREHECLASVVVSIMSELKHLAGQECDVITDPDNEL